MLRVTTESGTAYEFKDGRVRREPTGDAKPLRRDGEWLLLVEGTVPTVGEPLVMKLEPLGATEATWRRTSPVTAIGGEGPVGSAEMPAGDATRVRAAMGDTPWPEQ